MKELFVNFQILVFKMENLIIDFIENTFNKKNYPSQYIEKNQVKIDIIFGIAVFFAIKYIIDTWKIENLLYFFLVCLFIQYF